MSEHACSPTHVQHVLLSSHGEGEQPVIGQTTVRSIVHKRVKVGGEMGTDLFMNLLTVMSPKAAFLSLVPSSSSASFLLGRHRPYMAVPDRHDPQVSTHRFSHGTDWAISASLTVALLEGGLAPLAERQVLQRERVLFDRRGNEKK
jgi:hypothetical protein